MHFWGLVIGLVLFVGGVGFCTPAHAQLRGKWKLLKKRRGIKIYSMRVAHSSLLAVRGDVILDSPISKVIFLLNDMKYKKKWVGRLKHIRVIETITPLKRVIYAHFTLPWPVAHRDFVYRTHLVIDHKHKQLLWYTKSITHPKAPRTVGVRASVVYSLYTLRPIANGQKTFLRAEIHGNPKGWLPAWIVNIIQRAWPYKTMRGIQKALKLPFVKEHPMIKKVLQKWRLKNTPKLLPGTPG